MATPTPEAQENAKIIEDMLREAKGIDVPSELKKNPVIHAGDAELPAPMVVNTITSAGYMKVWDTRTFEMIPVLYYMLPQMLKVRRPDGSFRFTIREPAEKPVKGQFKCLLHKDAPDRKEYDAMGFRTCNKEGIFNEWQLRLHMQKKHPQEWAAIEAARKKKDEDEDRQLRRMLIQSSLSRDGLLPTETEKAKKVFKCDVCQEDFGSQKTLDKHKLEQHK